MSLSIRLAESGVLPDPVLRAGIRRLLRTRLRDEARLAGSCEPEALFLERVAEAPIAVATERANEQHYELPAEFFRLVLGPRLKYSACLWPTGTRSLAEAEVEMLRLTCERAGIEDGMRVLDLGCGWGSLSLFVAERYPRCRVTAVSNSESQIAFLRGRAVERGFDGLRAMRADVNAFEPEGRFDRVVSVEMFEHVRNHRALLERIARWLEEEGRLFVHYFCHRKFAYPYEVEGEDDWMARHFFTGGVMPSRDLLRGVGGPLRVERGWTVDGTHYERTLLAWLRNLDARREEAMRVLESHYGTADARTWFVRWRLFLLACAELFGYDGGNEWTVAHDLLGRDGGAS